MENMGKVVHLNGKTAYVQVKRASACGGDCSKCIGCGSTGTTVQLDNSIDAKEGDLVRIVSKENNLLTAVFYVYVIPLIAFFASYLFILSRFRNEVESSSLELKALAVGFIIMSAFYFLLKLFNKRILKSSKFELRMEKSRKQ